VKVILVLVVLIVAAMAGMAATGFCPPAGPWPQPPWCSITGKPLASSPTTGLDLTGQADLYEAFGQSTLDEPWLAGSIPGDTG